MKKLLLESNSFSSEQLPIRGSGPRAVKVTQVGGCSYAIADRQWTVQTEEIQGPVLNYVTNPCLMGFDTSGDAVL